MPRRNPPTVAPSRPAYGGPQVMGPGQGMLPLGPRDDVIGPFGTGQRGQGPALPPDVGPFEQTGTDIMNLWEHGTTAPHWSNRQMSQMYNLPLYKLLGRNRQGQAGTAIGSAELDRMYQNVSGGLGYYGGQLLPEMFGTIPGFARGGDFMTNGPQMIMVGDNPGGRERVQIDPMAGPPDIDPDFDPFPPDYEDPIPIPAKDVLPGIFGPGMPPPRPGAGQSVWPDWDDIRPPGQMPLPPARLAFLPGQPPYLPDPAWGGPFYDPNNPPNKVYTDPKTVSGIPGTESKRDANVKKIREWMRRKIFKVPPVAPPAPRGPISELF